MPDIVIGRDKERSFRVNELRGRFVILDFYTSGCIACFKSLPQLKELQEKHGGLFEFITVGKEDKSVRKVYEKYNALFDLKFKYVFDSAVFRLLNIEEVPKYVWIDDNGIVQGITGKSEVTEKNLIKFLDRRPVRIVDKLKRSVNPGLPLLIRNNGAPDSLFLIRSVLFKWNDSLDYLWAPSIDYSITPSTFQVMNVTLGDLFNYAWFGHDKWLYGNELYGKVWKEPIWETEDTALKIEKYGYSITVPPLRFSRLVLQQSLKEDIWRYTGLRAREEMRKVSCWKLIATKSAKQRLLTKGKPPNISVSKIGVELRNKPLKHLLYTLNVRTLLNEVIIDETGIKGNVDLDLRAVMSNLDDVNRGLSLSGLKLVPSQIMMRALVIFEE